MEVLDKKKKTKRNMKQKSKSGRKNNKPMKTTPTPQRKNMTRAQHAREALMAAMPKDYWGNLGLNEAYRMGLDDMVAWIDLGHEPPFTGVPKPRRVRRTPKSPTK